MSRERDGASAEMGPETKLGAAFGALLSSGNTAAAAAALNGDLRRAGRMRALPDGGRSLLLMGRDDNSPQDAPEWTRPIGRVVGDGSRLIVYTENGRKPRKLAAELDDQVSLASLSITEAAIHGDRVHGWISHIVDLEHQATPEARERLGKIGQFSSGLYGLRTLREVLNAKGLVRAVNDVCARRGLIATLNDERTQLWIADEPSATNIARVSLVDGEVKAVSHIAKRLAERIVRAAVISADSKLDLLSKVQGWREAEWRAERERKRQAVLAEHTVRAGEEFRVEDLSDGNDIYYVALRDLGPEDLALAIAGEDIRELGMAEFAPEVKRFATDERAYARLLNAIRGEPDPAALDEDGPGLT